MPNSDDPHSSPRPYAQLLADRRRRHRRFAALAAAGVIVVVVAALAIVRAVAGDEGTNPRPTSPRASTRTAGAVTIGSAQFPESVLLADLYGDAMAARGVKVTKRLRIGERATYIAALRSGQIGAVPEYSGSMLAFLDRRSIAKTPDDVYAELQNRAAENAMVVTEYAPAQDSDTITVTAATAARYHLTSIGDLKPIAATLTFGGSPQFRARADGIAALASVYGVRFGRFKVTDAGGSRTVNGLTTGSIDAGDIFSTDPAITTYGFVPLQDPKSMFSANNVVPLFRRDVLTPTMRTACDAVSAALDTRALAALVVQVVRDKHDPEQVARTWLKRRGLA